MLTRFWVATATASSLMLSGCVRNAVFNWQQSASTNSAISYYNLSYLIGQNDANSLPNLTYGLSQPQGIFNDGTRLFVADTLNHRVLIWNTIPTSLQTKPDVVLGQPNLATVLYNNTAGSPGTPSGQSLAGPTSVFSDGTSLYVTDRGNNRVLIWNTIPTTSYAFANVVVGQPNFGIGSAGTSQNRLNNPFQAIVAGSSLVVSDTSNNRLMIWSSIPSSNGALATLEWGNAANNFTTGTTSSVTSSTTSSPTGLLFVSGKFYVADSGYNRVLVFTGGIPAAYNTAASDVLGQTSSGNFTVSGTGITSLTFNNPMGLASDGTNLFVAEQGNSRISYYNTLVTAGGIAATYVFGQTALGVATIPSGITTPSASIVFSPMSVSVSAGKFWVADTMYSRILSLPIPTTNGQSATLVLGQPNFTEANESNYFPRSGNVLNYPTGVTISNGNLLIADRANHRVLIWNGTPSTTQTAATGAIGQANLSVKLSASPPTATSLNTPTHVSSDGTNIYVTDNGNHRVLAYPANTTGFSAAATTEVGQTSLILGNLGCSATALANPSQSYSDGSHLWVADRGNNRIVGFNLPLGAAGANSATILLGQNAMANFTANYNGINGGTMSSPSGIFSDGSRLYVADTLNHRILIWNTIPTGMGQPADVILGQPSDTTNVPNYGGLSASSLRLPSTVIVSQGRLYVADSGNYRVLVYNTIPTTNYQAASYVIGQSNFTSWGPNNGGISANTLSLSVPSINPTNAADTGLFFDPASKNLYITDPFNFRLLVLQQQF